MSTAESFKTATGSKRWEENPKGPSALLRIETPAIRNRSGMQNPRRNADGRDGLGQVGDNGGSGTDDGLGSDGSAGDNRYPHAQKTVFSHLDFAGKMNAGTEMGEIADATIVIDGGPRIDDDLGPAGNTGFDLMTAHLMGRIAIEVRHKQRTRTDEAHVPAEDVDQFGQLVDARRAQESSEGGETLFIGEQFSLCVAFICYRAEFIHKKRAPFQAGALLTKEDGAAKVSTDQQSDDGEKGAQQQEPQAGGDDVESPLGPFLQG